VQDASVIAAPTASAIVLTYAVLRDIAASISAVRIAGARYGSGSRLSTIWEPGLGAIHGIAAWQSFGPPAASTH
jgi:hypothetical protein